MKLYMSPTSPFARLARVVVMEKGLEDRIEMVPVNPWDSTPEFVRVNPVSKVPALVTDEGVALTESLLVVQYLERSFPEPVLMPPDDVDAVYHKLGLGHGIADQAVAIIATGKMAGEQGVPKALVERRTEGLNRTLAALEVGLAGRAARPDIGDLAVAVGLEYLDFRFPDMNWAGRFPSLKGWYAELRERPSLARTRPG